MNSRFGAIAIILILVSAPIQAGHPQSLDRESSVEVHGEYASEQILVKYREEASVQLMNSSRQRVGSQVVQYLSNNSPRLQLQQLPMGMGVIEAISALRDDPSVEFAEPNYIVRTSSLSPDDTYFHLLWGLSNTGQSGGVEDIDIDAPETWAVTTGSSDVVVGVIDTGIDYSHVDLAANMWVNPGEIPDNGLDDDGNGLIDDIHGLDAEGNTGDPFDDNDHGTHVAGTIGAVGDNQQGVVGVSWNVRLMALKFLNFQGTGLVSDAIECINYAIEMKNRGVNLRVLNASWGGAGASLSLESAIKAAGEAGILFVAAAGNNGDGNQKQGMNNDVQPFYPANYKLSNLISVAAIDRYGELAGFSNYGPGSVDVAAPGSFIASTIPFDEYALSSGTSMATPHVSGVAALLVSENSDLSPSGLKSIIMQGVESLPSLQGKILSGGMLNAYNSMQLVDEEEPIVGDFRLSFTKVQVSIEAGESVDYDIFLRSLDEFSGQVTLAANLTPDPGGVSISWSRNPVTLSAGGREVATLTLATSLSIAPGQRTLTIEGRAGGLIHTLSLEVTIESASSDPDEPPTFNLSVTPDSQVVKAGSWVAFTINAERRGHTEPIKLEMLTRGSNEGVSLLTLYPNPVIGSQAVALLFINSATSSRTETLLVRGRSASGIVGESNPFALTIRQ